MTKIATLPGIFELGTPILVEIWTNRVQKDFSIKFLIFSFFGFFFAIFVQLLVKWRKFCKYNVLRGHGIGKGGQKSEFGFIFKRILSQFQCFFQN